MISDKTRGEFEAWLLEEYGLEAEWQAERNCFKEFPAHLAYQAWQASRAAVVVEPVWPYHHDYTNSDVAGAAILDCCIAFNKAARNAGLKVKP